jgi:uncharacterized membrane protein YhaH (DUF805 family)
MSAKIGLWEHFRKLADFTGREDRASFWPYAALVFAIVTIAGMFIFVPMMAHAMTEMQGYAAQHPEQTTVVSSPGHYSISVKGDHPDFFPASSMAAFLGVTFGLAIILYAAAATRRLHDTGKSGFWALLPLPFIIYSSVMMPRMFAFRGEPDVTLFFSIFFSNMLYIVTLIVLIILLAGASRSGPNRYDTVEG